MSDGPHRTLRMRAPWKKFSEFADNAACSPEEVASAGAAALAQGWREEISEALVNTVCEIFVGNQGDLFGEQRVSQLEALKKQIVGSEFGGLFIDCTILVASEGGSGREAVEEAARNALSIMGARGARQVEEHYYRKSSTGRAFKVRARIETALGSASCKVLARQLLNMDATPAPRHVPRHTGLDEGVRL